MTCSSDNFRNRGDLWAETIKKEYPSADVTIFDLPDHSNVPSNDPPNIKLKEIKAVVEGLPYNDNTFDLVQQRYRSDMFPEQQFKEKVINDYIRIIKPGGWIEFSVFIADIFLSHIHMYMFMCSCYIICICLF